MKRAIAASVILLSHVAYADATKECIAADTQAQEMRRAGKLHDALGQLDACTNAACPALVRADCTERVDEINRVMPSVVFDVKTASGVDVEDTRVEMDGRALRDRLDGLPVNVDPGEHVFVLTARGSSQTIHVLAHEGEKSRRVAMTVGEALTPPKQPELVPAGGGQRTLGLVLGVGGLVSIALGSVFGGVVIAEHADVTRICPNSLCANAAALSDVAAKNSDSQTFATLSTIAFVAGVALFAAGVVVYVTAPRVVRVGIGPGAIMGVF